MVQLQRRSILTSERARWKPCHLLWPSLESHAASSPPLNSVQQGSHRVPFSFKGRRSRLRLFMGSIKVLEERSVPEILLWLCLKNRVFHIPTYPRDKCVPSILFSSVVFPLCSLILGIIISLGIFSHCPRTKGLLVLGDGEWSKHNRTKQV